jgi:hypothetical protein
MKIWVVYNKNDKMIGASVKSKRAALDEAITISVYANHYTSKNGFLTYQQIAKKLGYKIVQCKVGK